MNVDRVSDKKPALRSLNSVNDLGAIKKNQKRLTMTAEALLAADIDEFDSIHIEGVDDTPFTPAISTPTKQSMPTRNASTGGGGTAAAAVTSKARDEESKRQNDADPVLCVAVVEEDYVAEEDRELTIHTGDRLNILRKNEATGWWLGVIIGTGDKGWVPGTYLAVE